MPNKPLILINIALLGLVLWFAFQPQSTPEVEPPGAQTEAPAIAEINQLKQRIAMLERDLDDEIAARIDLQQRLQEPPAAINSESFSRDETQLPQTISDSVSSDENTPAVEPESIEERLIAVGMPSDTVRAMKSSVDRKQWQMLQLRDRAIREGWNDSDDYRQQMAELSNPFQGLREEFGDEAYDQYLYASGTPNRVEVQEVYSGSAAADAGLQPGDIVLSYATNTIYSMSSLRESTLEGFSGETILLELERDGRIITTSVPRGPLGITMSAVVVKPD